ncbi:MAG: hypothetical protein DRJ61_15480 [Acidobacteria bacterium]|nr:MAG: hypothetical protein DRJ61_15480 [Acidobacteriota bacterium]
MGNALRLRAVVLICGAAMLLAMAPGMPAGAASLVLLNNSTLVRGGYLTLIIVPDGSLIMSQDAVNACQGVTVGDDVLVFDPSSGACSRLMGSDLVDPFLPIQAFLPVPDGPAVHTVQACLDAHQAVLVDPNSGLASCFAWFHCSPLSPAISGPSAMCSAGSVTLDAGAGYSSYLWSPGGEITSQITVSPASTTAYSVAVTDGAGCTGLDDHTVTVVTTPAAPLAGDHDQCDEPPVLLTWAAVTGATGYDLRVDGSVIVTNVVSPYAHDPGDTAVHNYEIRANGPGCTGVWSQRVSFRPGRLFCDDFESGDTIAWSNSP